MKKLEEYTSLQIVEACNGCYMRYSSTSNADYWVIVSWDKAQEVMEAARLQGQTDKYCQEHYIPAVLQGSDPRLLAYHVRETILAQIYYIDKRILEEKLNSYYPEVIEVSSRFNRIE